MRQSKFLHNYFLAIIRSRSHAKRAAGSSWLLDNAFFASLELCGSLYQPSNSAFDADSLTRTSQFLSSSVTERKESKQSLFGLEQRSRNLFCTTQPAKALFTRWAFDHSASSIFLRTIKGSGTLINPSMSLTSIL